MRKDAKEGPPAKPPTYAFYPRGQGSICNVLQLRRVKGGETVPADELQLYRALEAIQTPYHRINIAKGSVLVMAQDAVAEMLAAGTVEPLLEVPQIPWRQGRSAKDSNQIG